jgi:Heparinase II/III-like protein/Heparinase II/III N-terminus
VSGLAWKLARLRVMTPREIAHRAAIAMRDRFAPPAYTRWTPDEAFRHLFEGSASDVLRASPLARLVRVVDSDACAAEIAAARALLDGGWMLFGADVRLGNPPRWNVNPRTGAAWPDVPSDEIDYHDTSIAGDPKDTWELGRLTVLPVLAIASRATGERAFADRAIQWLDDFTARNPLGSGIHHTSGIEQAVRIINVTWTLALLGSRAAEVKLEPCLGLLAQQALACRDHLSLGSSANNHLIAEYAAMTVMGSAWPALRGARELRQAGLRGLERETLRQFTPDGVHREQSLGYLPFIWELLLESFVAAEAAGERVSNEVRVRLGASLEFARAIRYADGTWPRIGDEDDGRILIAGERASRLDLVGNALAAWLGADALDAKETGLAQCLCGAARAPRAAANGVRETADYTVWRDGETVVTFDHGPLGLEPLAAHGHADALSITIQRGRDAIVVDPGTFAYHSDREARDRCRSTPAHSTVHFGGRSQARMRGPFLWERMTRCESGPGTGAASASEAAGWSCTWSGGEWHRRSVSVDGERIVIHDRVRPAGDAHIAFALGPHANVELSGTLAMVTVGTSRATFEAQGLEPWRLEPAEVAPRYGVRVPARRLTARFTSDASQVTIELAAGQ